MAYNAERALPPELRLETAQGCLSLMVCAIKCRVVRMSLRCKTQIPDSRSGQVRCLQGLLRGLWATWGHQASSFRMSSTMSCVGASCGRSCSST